MEDLPLLEVTMLLADSAQVADGKLYVLGGGLQMVGPNPQPVAIGLLLAVPWDRANISHDWQLELLDEDGLPVMHNETPVLVGGTFEAGRPPGWPSGTALSVPLGITFNALPVQSGHRYTWRLSVNGTSEPSWRVSFGVAAAPAQAS